MKSRAIRTIAAVAAATTLASVVFTVSTSAAPAKHSPPSVEGLRILLTNDDSVQGASASGTDGKGMYELRKSLCAAGADVVVVGPWAQQSGAGARVTTPGFTPVSLHAQAVTPPGPYGDDCSDASSAGLVIGVCLGAGPCTSTSATVSPADTVLVGLQRFVPDNVWPDGPDLVLSGTNFGQNAGEAVNHSGTVGAAITAHELGAPTIAFSAEFDVSCSPNPLACVPFAQTGEFAVDLIGRLNRRGLIDHGLALNVNFPVVRSDEELGHPVYAVVGTGTNLSSAYEGDVGTEGGTYSLVLGEPTPELRRNADTTALNGNDIPITPLDGDWTATKGTARIRGFINAEF